MWTFPAAPEIGMKSWEQYAEKQHGMPLFVIIMILHDQVETYVLKDKLKKLINETYFMIGDGANFSKECNQGSSRYRRHPRRPH